jgi:hypothetical protein
MGVGRGRPGVTTVGRFVRGMRFDRNPLRRVYDRAETVVLILLTVLFLVGAPLSALAAGAGMHSAAQRAELAQHASKYQVTATIETATGAPASGGNLTTEVTARWTMPNGTVVNTEMAVPIGTTPGDKVNVWTTRDGRLTTAPLSESQVASLTDLAEFAGVAVLALVVALAGVIARWWLNRRRMAAWDADWRATGPRWTTRA